MLVNMVALAACLPLAARVEVPGAQWIEVDASEGRKIPAAVFRPEGNGPFPAVIVLHGGDGFRIGYVRLASNFASWGFVGVAGCWFAGFAERPGRTVPPPGLVDCPQGQTLRGSYLAATRDVMALIDAARKLPGVQPDRVGLFGISRGAAIALLVASTGGAVKAVVSSDAPYADPRLGDTPPITLARSLQAPLLMLHGTADELVNIVEAREYERAVRTLGKPVEAHYYPGASHGVPFRAQSREDVLRRAVAFFRRHLAP